jgi:mRNA-degrading endonuclease RelE of RelBE toxin-antitoxin system
MAWQIEFAEAAARELAKLDPPALAAFSSFCASAWPRTATTLLFLYLQLRLIFRIQF